jgi:uncharacterized protein (DUF2141 family)
MFDNWINSDLIYINDILNENGEIRIRISKKNRQHNGQKKKVQKDKQRSTKHTHKTKYCFQFIYLL